MFMNADLPTLLAEVERAPLDPGAWLHLARALLSRSEESGTTFAWEQVTRLTPGDPALWLERAEAERQLSNRASARSSLARAAGLPCVPGLARRLVPILLEEGLAQEAEALLSRTVADHPETADLRYELVALLRRSERYEAAAEHLVRLVRDHPQDPTFLGAYGTVLSNLRRWDEARPILERALRHRPDDRDLLSALARLLERTGDPQAAWSLLDAHRDQLDWNANLAACWSSVCVQLQRPEEALPVLQRALERADRPDQRGFIEFAHGAALDASGQHDAAFRAWRRANGLRTESFDPEAHQRYVDRLVASFSTEALPELPRANHGDDRPVFIVGMPRSGTSLVEQILACHPDLHAAGELTWIPSIVAQLEQRGHWPDLHRLPADLVDSAARSYLDELDARAGSVRRFTDKLPHNALHLGLIALLFPEARVIHCRRDPVDTCVSCFAQNFYGPYAYTTRLSWLASFYRDYHRLTAHWQEVLPLAIHEVHYERLVEEPASQTRELVDFLGLPWDPVCLAPHERRGVMDSASYAQVRRPIYRSSVERWRRYEGHLGPLLKGLGPLGPALSTSDSA